MQNQIKLRSLNTLCFIFIFINQNFAQTSFTESNLPIIVINTNTQPIVDEPKITCDMGIIWNGEGNRNRLDDPFNEYDGKIGIEFRGSTSQLYYPKENFALETRDSLGENLNVQLLGLPKENDWVLYGPYTDKSLMRNTITYDLFRQMQPWSPRFVYCELVINNRYLGLYILMEKIKRDNDRIDIAKLESDEITGDDLTGGYIIKIDKPTGSSNTPWNSEYQIELKFLYHDPKYEELAQEQRDYIKNYVADFEDVIYSAGFDDPVTGYNAFIDVGSFIDFMLMQELGKTVDGYRSSSFMYKDKDSKGGKLTCGPMWDFNLSYGNANYCEAFDTTGWQYNFTQVCDFDNEPPNWWARLLEDPNFTNQLQCRWQDLRATILSENHINNWIDSIALHVSEAQERNFSRWPVLDEYIYWNYFIGETYQEEIDYLKWWFKARSAYLDANLPGNCEDMITSNTPNEAIKPSSLLYPNPTRGVLFSAGAIEARTAIKVLSITGQTVDFKRSENKIDLGHLPKGMYVVVIEDQFVKVVKY